MGINNQSQIVLNVPSGNVLEPSSLVLIGFGLAGIVAVKSKPINQSEPS
jgi:hypothetical protein